MFKNYVQRRLEKFVKKYFKKHNVKLIVVVGSVGKTTTKYAIANVLARRYRVIFNPGNMNSKEISVQLAILGLDKPPKEKLRSPLAWMAIFSYIKKRIRKKPADVDVIVQELGTARPGEIPHFSSYLRPDIAVVTAVSPEHMENFPGGMEEVAREELSVASYSDLTIINRDNVSDEYAQFADTTNLTTYGLNDGEYHLEILSGTPLNGYECKFFGPEFPNGVHMTIRLLGEHSLKSALAAITVATKMKMSGEEIAAAIQEFRPVNGRMNPLRGAKGSTIIDDTYNAAPDAVKEAIRTLYQIEAPQRIAILGSMNELGEMSAEAHQEIGNLCEPTLLDWVITIGKDAENFLAPAAKKMGNKVRSFSNPVAAGIFVRNRILEDGAVVLVKGSQNGVFAEEATKMLLGDAAEESKLVRQEFGWMEKKSAWIESLKDTDQSNIQDY